MFIFPVPKINLFSNPVSLFAMCYRIWYLIFFFWNPILFLLPVWAGNGYCCHLYHPRNSITSPVHAVSTVAFLPLDRKVKRKPGWFPGWKRKTLALSQILTPNHQWSRHLHVIQANTCETTAESTQWQGTSEIKPLSSVLACSMAGMSAQINK